MYQMISGEINVATTVWKCYIGRIMKREKNEWKTTSR